MEGNCWNNQVSTHSIHPNAIFRGCPMREPRRLTVLVQSPVVEQICISKLLRPSPYERHTAWCIERKTYSYFKQGSDRLRFSIYFFTKEDGSVKQLAWLFFKYVLFWLLFFFLQRSLFIYMGMGGFQDLTWTDLWTTQQHAFPLDLSMTGYILALPAVSFVILLFLQSEKDLNRK